MEFETSEEFVEFIKGKIAKGEKEKQETEGKKISEVIAATNEKVK